MQSGNREARKRRGIIVARASLATLLVCVFLTSCAQTKQYTPRPAATLYQLAGLPANVVDVKVSDLRPEVGVDDGLGSVLRAQLLAALSPQPASAATGRYTLSVDIIEHRSFFTLGNWNGATRFRIKLISATGSVIGQWDATGTARLSNMWGYATAVAVSQDAYNVALADMMSSLSQILYAFTGVSSSYEAS